MSGSGGRRGRAGCRWLGHGRGWSFRSARRGGRRRGQQLRRHRLTGLADDGEDLPDGHGVALGGKLLEQDARAAGGHGDDGLVRLDLRQILAQVDVVALGLEPLDDYRFLRVVAHAGHEDGGGHIALPASGFEADRF